MLSLGLVLIAVVLLLHAGLAGLLRKRRALTAKAAARLHSLATQGPRRYSRRSDVNP